MSNIKCPFHDDQTASMALYEDSNYFHCFGCGAHDKIEKLRSVGVEVNKLKLTSKPKVDLVLELARIATLPRKLIRGLELPYDDKGYYILYPNTPFYQLRYHSDDSARYFYPAPAPLFIRAGSTRQAVVVEGQINALSIPEYFLEQATIMSPGSASQLISKKVLDFLSAYDKVLIIADRDPAGITSGLKLKLELAKKGKRVETLFMIEDLNDVLQRYGKGTVEKEIKEALDML